MSCQTPNHVEIGHSNLPKLNVLASSALTMLSLASLGKLLGYICCLDGSI
jgi:hypothetical protein